MRTIALLATMLVLNGCRAHKNDPIAEGSAGAQVVRAHRIEITDDAGQVRAIVGFRSGSSEPEVTLLNKNNEPSATLLMDSREQPTLFFRDPNGRNGGSVEGRVAVGYLWGSDSLNQPGEYDPLGSWGIRILRKDAQGFLTLHDLTLADPNEHDLTRFVSPVRIPPDKSTHAHRR